MITNKIWQCYHTIPLRRRKTRSPPSLLVVSRLHLILFLRRCSFSALPSCLLLWLGTPCFVHPSWGWKLCLWSIDLLVPTSHEGVRQGFTRQIGACNCTNDLIVTLHDGEKFEAQCPKDLVAALQQQQWSRKRNLSEKKKSRNKIVTCADLRLQTPLLVH